MRINNARERGNSVIEATLMVPWLLFLFIGIFDFGFFAYSAIATENAARVAALHISSDISIAGDVTISNQMARADVCKEMASLPNVGAGCPAGVVQVVVQPQPNNGPDGQPAAQVSVTYTTDQLIPIPGLLMGKMTLTRTVEVRI